MEVEVNRRTQQLLVAPVLAAALGAGSFGAGAPRAVAAPSGFHYTSHQIGWGEPHGINDQGTVVGITGSDCSGSGGVFIYKKRRTVIGLAPGGWTHAYAYGVNNDGVMAVSTDDIYCDSAAGVPRQSVRRSGGKTGAFVLRVSNGKPEWYQLPGGTDAYRIADDGDILGDRGKTRTLWVYQNPYFYVPRSVHITPHDMISDGARDVLVGSNKGAAFLEMGLPALSLTAPGTPAKSTYAASVARVSSGSFVVAGCCRDATVGKPPRRFGLVWQVSCDTSRCRQLADPSLVPLPKPCRGGGALGNIFVNSSGLTAGWCYPPEFSSLGNAPFVSENGHTQRLLPNLRDGAAWQDVQGLNSRGQIAGDCDDTHACIATPAGS
jgi:hypothetical protein